jgi:hypothetical protein
MPNGVFVENFVGNFVEWIAQMMGFSTKFRTKFPTKFSQDALLGEGLKAVAREVFRS